MCKNEALCMKFPAVLRDKLLNGELVLTDITLFEYEPVHAYRAIEREATDNSPVNRADFCSYFELKKTPKRPRGLPAIDYEKDVHYYGASCFTKREIVEQIMKLPNPHKKLAEGYVCQECGAQETKDYHICWWLYDNVEISSFTLMEEN